jgi:hypothetical protein
MGQRNRSTKKLHRTKKREHGREEDKEKKKREIWYE